MANIIKIPCGQNQGQNLLPFSDISHIRTYCTPYNFTYSMTADNEWGEYTPNTPAWATTNYWMNQNFVPNNSSPSWALTDNGTTVHLLWTYYRDTTSSGTITFDISSTSSPISEFTCYIVGKFDSGNLKSLFWLSRSTWEHPDDPDAFFHIGLFNHYNDQIGIEYKYGWAQGQSGSRYIQPDSNRNYHVFAFKWTRDPNGCPCTLNVDGTSDSFQTPTDFVILKSYFPAGGLTQDNISEWDIKLIAFLDVAESDDVIANNVNILRMIYQ